MTRSAGTVTSLKRVTVPQHPDKKGRAGSVTLIGQNPSAQQTSPWGGIRAEVGLAVEWGLGHEVGYGTGATGLKCGSRWHRDPEAERDGQAAASGRSRARSARCQDPTLSAEFKTGAMLVYVFQTTSQLGIFFCLFLRTGRYTSCDRPYQWHYLFYRF